MARMPTVRGEPDFAEESEQQLDDQRQAQRALTLLRKLPPREQDVFFLCAVMELSYEDAALALHAPVGTVRSRLSRARARLRELDSSFGHEQGESTTVQEAHQP